VIWEFAGEPIPASLLDDLTRVIDELTLTLSPALDEEEIEALLERAVTVAERGRFPVDTTGRRYPWPLV
jgi:hypothetical protein